MVDFVTAVLIAVGAVIIVMSAIGTRRVLSIVRDSQYRRYWQALFVLMLFFAAGYLVALVLTYSEVTTVLLALTGVIFFFGALFVLLVVRIGFLTINDLVETQQRLEFARDEALESSRLKSELLARVSHELRTPLHAILGYADMLRSEIHGDLNPRQGQDVARITLNTDRLIMEINHLMRQAQIEAGQLEIRREPFALADLLSHVDTVAAPLSEQKGIVYEVVVTPAVPDTLTGDVQRLREIVVNLVGNAVKFTEQGAVTLRVDRPEPGRWQIDVSDTGPGIAPEAMPRIFEPFQQADGSVTRRFGGSGLGLSIVKQLVELMDGSVSVRSAPGEGSTFTVILPMAMEPQAETGQ